MSNAPREWHLFPTLQLVIKSLDSAVDFRRSDQGPAEARNLMMYLAERTLELGDAIRDFARANPGMMAEDLCVDLAELARNLESEAEVFAAFSRGVRAVHHGAGRP